MEYENLKNEIRKKIFSSSASLFSDLMFIPGFKGTQTLSYIDPEDPTNRNLIMWHGLSENATKVLVELVRDNEIRLVFGKIAFYSYGHEGTGISLPLPIANEVKARKTPAWLPTLIKRVEKVVDTDKIIRQ